MSRNNNPTVLRSCIALAAIGLTILAEPLLTGRSGTPEFRESWQTQVGILFMLPLFAYELFKTTDLAEDDGQRNQPPRLR